MFVVVPGLLCLVFVYMWLGLVGAKLFPGHAHAQYRRGKEKGGSALSCIRGAMQLGFRLLKFPNFPVYNTYSTTIIALSQHPPSLETRERRRRHKQQPLSLEDKDKDMFESDM